MSIFDNKPTRDYKSAGIKMRRYKNKLNNLDPFAPDYEKKSKKYKEQIARCIDTRRMASKEIENPKPVTNNNQTTHKNNFSANYNVNNYGVQIQPGKQPKKKR